MTIVLRVLRPLLVTAIVAGAAVACYAERATLRGGLAVLPHTRIGWVVAGVAAECVSMAALAQLERGLLRAGGADLTLPTMMATAYTSNAIAVAVPVVGSGLATAYSYRELRRYGAAAELAGVALTVAGVFSTASFAAIAAAGAAASGDPAAAWASAAGGLALAVVAGTALLALRFTRPRAVFVVAAAAILRLSARLTRRPRGDPRRLVAGALDRVGALRVSGRAAGYAFCCALVNWLADIACLICALCAAGAAVPWRAIVLVWSAGAGAASLTPIPAGLGVVDVVLIAALTGSGLRSATAVAAVLLYRIITFKIVITGAWITARSVRRRAGSRAGPRYSASPEARSVRSIMSWWPSTGARREAAGCRPRQPSGY